MRKKMLLLALSLAALAGSLTTQRAQAVSGTHSCRFGCRSCICDASGLPIACTNVYC
jgi:hypothetical protein